MSETTGTVDLGARQSLKQDWWIKKALAKLGGKSDRLTKLQRHTLSTYTIHDMAGVPRTVLDSKTGLPIQNPVVPILMVGMDLAIKDQAPGLTNPSVPRGNVSEGEFSLFNTRFSLDGEMTPFGKMTPIEIKKYPRAELVSQREAIDARIKLVDTVLAGCPNPNLPVEQQYKVPGQKKKRSGTGN